MATETENTWSTTADRQRAGCAGADLAARDARGCRGLGFRSAYRWLRRRLPALNYREFEATAHLSDAADRVKSASDRVSAILAAITGMYFKPDDRNEPFGPMTTLADGRRSPAPADFRGEPVATLAELAKRATNPVLRARLADVCWTLGTQEAADGQRGGAAYVEIVRRVDAGEAGGQLSTPRRASSSTPSSNILAPRLGYRSGAWLGEGGDGIRAGGERSRLKQRATEERALVPVLWFGKLDLDFRISTQLRWEPP